MGEDVFGAVREFSLSGGRSGRYHALAALEDKGIADVSRLPVSLRIVLESLLRNCDGRRVTAEHVRQLAAWKPNEPRTAEIPFVVARILLQDFTGVPLLCDLAAMRDAARRQGRDATIVEPRVPVDLVADHSVQVDAYNSPSALEINMTLEFRRNTERYRFIKWGMQAFDSLRVVPPGIGIVHQVNLEYLARGVQQKDGVYFPDTLVGTDSHTTMINALGVVGWGVGGIEAEAGMLGQPIYVLTPDVVGVHLKGRLREGTTATDLVLEVTRRLRAARVVGKFVEFHGEGAASLSVPDRATIANMAPEYGATMGFFPVDAETVNYLAATGRTGEEIDAFQAYFSAQGLFGMPAAGAIDYSETIEIDLAEVRPGVAGPGRPQDHIPLPELGQRFTGLFSRPAAEGGYGKPADELRRRFDVLPMQPGAEVPPRPAPEPVPTRHVTDMADHDRGAAPPPTAVPCAKDIGHGDVLIAAITSCTNTSNPDVMIGAGLLAKKAVERGLSVGPRVKTSLAPGSRVVTDYLRRAGLLPALERLGFHVVAYGCTTCIGNAGPLAAPYEEAIARHDLVCAAVLSGNRNFEARIHPALKANFLMSPPLVVAFAIAGRVDIDMTREPLGQDAAGRPVMLADVWPTPQEIAAAMRGATDPGAYRDLYRDPARANPMWDKVPAPTGEVYAWEATSTYIAEPPFFAGFAPEPGGLDDIRGARALAIFGNSVTTDHISPAGSIKAASPAGIYLQAHGVAPGDFNSYGSRRGNHEAMMRGTFANVRIRNLMLPPGADGSRAEGGYTVLQPDGETMTIYDAAMRYSERGTPTLVFAGEEYGTGSSRDWAAKGPRLLGVRAVVAKSFERIHRSNLVGMGIVPLQFAAGDDAATLGIAGDEEFDVLGLEAGIGPRQELVLVVRRPDGGRRHVPVVARVDTPVEADYLRHGGILPYVLRELLAA